jgi:hypothetical protein
MKYAWLVIILLLINCTDNKKNRQATMKEDETQYNILPAGNGQQGSDKSESLADPLILDGRPYIDKGKAYSRNEAHLITYMHCTFSLIDEKLWHSFEGMEQLVNLKNMSIYLEREINTVDFTPLASLPNLKSIALNGTIVSLYNLKGLKQLVNLEDLSIYWEGETVADVDFTPLASLPKLESLSFNRYITRLPDLTMLTNLRDISIGNLSTSAMLESLERIGAPNVRRITINNGREINSFAPLNNLVYLEFLIIKTLGEKEYKIADMANLPGLKHLQIAARSGKIDLQGIEKLSGLKYLEIAAGGKIDLRGIEKLSALEELWLECESFNIEGIGKLSNLKYLGLYLISPEPSLEFLRGMPNLRELYCKAGYLQSFSSYEIGASQVLDVSPLATLKNLWNLQCRGFIIKNISALDILKFSWGIDLIDSRLFDEKEESKHNLVFEAHKE